MPAWETIETACENPILGDISQAPVTTNNLLLHLIKGQQSMIEKLCELVGVEPPDPLEAQKCYKEKLFACLNTDTTETLLTFAVWEHPITKEICIVPFKENPNETPSAIINDFTDNYTMKQTAANLSDKVMQTEVCITDCVTGEVVRGFECINFDTKSKLYYDTEMELLNTDGALAENQVAGKNPVSLPLGLETIADVTTTATALGTVPANAGYAMIQPTGGAIIYTTDGTAPDVSDPNNLVGLILGEGGILELCSAKDIAGFQFISLNGDPVDINVTYKNVQEGN